MPFWIMFLFWLGSSILSALLTKPKIENARATGLDGFKVPTSMEGRAVPIIVGKVRLGGINTVWYGDLKSVAITEKVGGFLGIGAKRVTKGYRYYLGVQMALCSGPIDFIDRVWFSDKVIYSGGETTGPIVIDDTSFFGGEDNGGGIQFTLDLFRGTSTQAVSSYLALHQTPTPAYRRTAYVLLTDGNGGPGYIGDFDSLRNFAFEVAWYPNSLAVTGGKEKIGDDANPICFLYEILANNDDWGLELDTNDVLITGTAAQGALRALAEQCYDEGLGFSMIIDQQTEALEIIKEIERHVDGKFRLDLTDGKYKIILARPPAGAVPMLDDTNVSVLENFARGNWSETKNEIKIQFADRSKDYDETYASDHDGANLDIVGRKNITTLRFPGCKDAALANLLAARELRGLAFPLAKLRLKLDRTQYALQIGDPFDWAWPDLGITSSDPLPFRVIKVQYEDDHQGGEITVDAIEDVFRLETVGFNDPPPTFWTPPPRTAQAPLDARLWDPPYQLAFFKNTRHPAILISRNGGLHLTYDVYSVVGASAASPVTNDFVLTNTDLSNWTPTALLAGAVSRDLNGPPHYTDSIIIDGFNDITLGDMQDAANAAVDSTNPSNVILVDDEVMFFTAVADNMDGTFTLTVQRGAFGTIPADHADDTRMWFVGLGGDVVNSDATFDTAGQLLRCRVVTKTPSNELALAASPNIPSAAAFPSNYLAAYAAGDPQVNGQLFVDADWTKTPGFLRTTWKTRHESTQAFGTKQDDASVTPSSLKKNRVIVRRVDTDAIVQQADSTDGQFVGSGFIPQSSPGVPSELDFYMEINGLRTGTWVGAQQWVTQNFEVFGFGIDFGGDYGGQAGSTDPNYGVVLDQGAAPIVIDPVLPDPGADREYEIRVYGQPAAGDQLRIFYSVWDSFNGEFISPELELNLRYSTSPTLQSQDAVADYIESQMRDHLDGRAFTVSRVSLTDHEIIRIRTSYGSVSQRLIQHPNVSPLNVMPGQSVLQEPLGSQTGKRGNWYMDFWTTEFQAGDNVEVLADAESPYPVGTYQGVTSVFGLTIDAKDQLPNQFGNNTLVGSYALGVPISNRIAILGGIVDSINNSQLGQLGIVSAFPGTLTDVGSEMTRGGCVIQANQDFGLVETYMETHDYGLPSGLAEPNQKILTKPVFRPESANYRVEGPLPKVWNIGVTTSQGTHAGDQIMIIHTAANGTRTTIAQSIGGAGGQSDIQAAIDALAAAFVSAFPTYSTNVNHTSFNSFIRITGPDNTEYDVYGWWTVSGSTLVIEFERTL